MDKKIVIIVSFLLLIPLVIADESFQEMKQQAIDDAKDRKAEITEECMEDPYTCSCEQINCEDLLEAEHEKKEQAYDRCVKEKADCERQRQNAIKEIEETTAKIEAECRKNLDSCDCSAVKTQEGKEDCELAIIEARYQAEEEREEKITECMKDIDGCDCSTISDEKGKKECWSEVEKAKELKEKLEKACKENPVACDCSGIESESGKKECEYRKREALSEAKTAIKAALSKCFKDVDTCDCNDLGLEEESYITFCQVQKAYGLNCKSEGRDCDRLDAVEIYPQGMPPWLGTIFAKSYSDFIDKEKKKAAKDAAGIITTCINKPEECECDKTPSYAQAHCEKMKQLQLRCYEDDYDACIALEKAPHLPKGMPEFTVGFLESAINKLRSSREKASKMNAGRKVGSMILECMDDSSKCDCSFAPKGNIKAFCEHKKDLVILCRDKKQYDACFTLDEEPIVSEDMPDFIVDYVKKNVEPEVAEKKQKIFDEMKIGTRCEGASTISECKSIMKD